jgi:hypothetical protein
MNECTNILDPLRDVQIPIAFSRLQNAVTEHVEDMNRRFNAGLTVRQTQTTFEVHELEKAEALVTVSLTDKNDIQYIQFVKRDNQQQSGLIYVRACQDGPPILMFPDLPHPNVEVSYQEASKRLLDSSF